MNINKARQIAFDINLGRNDRYTNGEITQAFHRLHKSQPEKGNKMIVRSDRSYAQDLWNAVGTKGEAA